MFWGVVAVLWQRGWSCGGEMPPSATYLCGSEEPLAKLGCDIYREYQARLARTGVDFDDLIRLAALGL